MPLATRAKQGAKGDKLSSHTLLDLVLAQHFFTAPARGVSGGKTLAGFGVSTAVLTPA